MQRYIILFGIIVLFLIIIWIVTTYNKLVKLKNKVDDQWSQVDIQLKKRFDLIPNIVETVKGYTKHEKDTLNDLVKARTYALNASTPKEEISANNELSKTLNKLFVLAEAYPELKASDNFKILQENLKDVEDKIAYARQFYNDTVLKYKNAISMFPTVIIAGMLGFKQEKFFTINDEEKENVNVQI